MRRFEFQEGTSSKFWEVELSGVDVTTTWGRIGTAGQSKTKSFATPAKAQAEHDALVKEKVGKGYVEVGAGSSAIPRAVPVTQPPPAPTPPPAAPAAVEVVGAPPEPDAAPSSEPAPRSEIGVVWTDALRRRVHPRRTTGLPGPRVDGKAAWKRMREHWPTVSAHFLGSPAREDPVVGPLLAAAIGKLETASDAPPPPLDPTSEAMVGLLLAHRQGWGDPFLANPVVDYWTGSGGLDLAVAALCASLSMRTSGEKDAVGVRLEPSRGRSNTPLFANGYLTSFAHLRRLLAGADEGSWERARTRAAALREGAPLLVRGAVSYLFPDVPEWAAADAREVMDRDSWPLWGGSLVASLGDPVLLDAFVAKGIAGASYQVLPSLDSWSPLILELGLSMLEGAGVDAVPALERLFDAYSSTDERRQVADTLAVARSPRAIEALLSRLEMKEVVSAASEAVLHAPDLALAPLAAMSGKGAAGKAAEPLLVMLVRQSDATVQALLPGLPEASRRAVEAIRARVGPLREEASAAELPPVLAAPPWTRRKARNAETVQPLAPLPMADSMVWPAGLKESWGTTRSPYWKQILPGRGDAAILERFGLDDLVKDLPRLSDAELRERIANAPETRWRMFFSEALCFASETLRNALWEAAPPARWSDYDSHRVFLATYELAALPGLLRIAEATIGKVVDQLLPFRSARLAPFVADALARLKTARGDAQRWLLAHPEAAAVGLIPQAVGPAGKPRAAAAAALRFLAGSGHEATVMDAAARYGDAARDAVRGVLDTDQLDALPARLPKLPGFFAPSGFSRPFLRESGKALTEPAVEALGTMLAISRIDEPYAGIGLVKEACEPASLSAFAWDLFSAWLLAGAPAREAWAFEALGHLGDDGAARRLAPLVRQWPGEAAHARAVMGLDVLAAIGTDVALMHLNGIAQKVKFKGLQEKAREKIALVAERRGLTADEMADRLVPDLGLDDDGSRTLDFGPRAFRVGFDEQLRPFVRDSEGKRLPDLPKPGKSDDAEKGAAAVETWKALKKDAKTVASQQLLRLELAMCGRRRFSAEVYRDFFVAHPLVVHVVRRLVWGVYDDAERLLATFRVAEDGSLADASDDTFVLPEGARVGVVHALELPQDAAARWGQVFGDYEILQPFRQLGRETFRIVEAEAGEKALKRVEGIKVPTGKVLGLEQRGWRRGPAQDGGCSWWYERPLPGNLEAHLSLEPGIIAGMALEFSEQTLRTVTLERPGTWSEGGVLTFGALDPVLFSEIVRDLEALRP